jgi:hypothetical protein
MLAPPATSRRCPGSVPWSGDESGGRSLPRHRLRRELSRTVEKAVPRAGSYPWIARHSPTRPACSASSYGISPPPWRRMKAWTSPSCCSIASWTTCAVSRLRVHFPMRFLLVFGIDQVGTCHLQVWGNLTKKSKRRNLFSRRAALFFLGCSFSLSGLRYSLRKPAAVGAAANKVGARHYHETEPEDTRSLPTLTPMVPFGTLVVASRKTGVSRSKIALRGTFEAL